MLGRLCFGSEVISGKNTEVKDFNLIKPENIKKFHKISNFVCSILCGVGFLGGAGGVLGLGMMGLSSVGWLSVPFSLSSLVFSGIGICAAGFGVNEIFKRAWMLPREAAIENAKKSIENLKDHLSAYGVDCSKGFTLVHIGDMEVTKKHTWKEHTIDSDGKIDTKNHSDTDMKCVAHEFILCAEGKKHKYAYVARANSFDLALSHRDNKLILSLCEALITTVIGYYDNSENDDELELDIAVSDALDSVVSRIPDVDKERAQIIVEYLYCKRHIVYDKMKEGIPEIRTFKNEIIPQNGRRHIAGICWYLVLNNDGVEWYDEPDNKENRVDFSDVFDAGIKNALGPGTKDGYGFGRRLGLRR